MIETPGCHRNGTSSAQIASSAAGPEDTQLGDATSEATGEHRRRGRLRAHAEEQFVVFTAVERQLFGFEPEPSAERAHAAREGQTIQMDLGGEATFAKAKFYRTAKFDECSFASPANFDQAEFLQETTGPLVPAARFQKTEFGSRTDFRNTVFAGMAEFQRAAFSANARFDEAEFKADAVFEGALFDGTAGSDSL